MDNQGVYALLHVMAFDCDIAVIGGGLSGCVLALALAQDGFHVKLLEARPADASGQDGRGYALAVSAHRLCEALGLWPGLMPKAQPIMKVKVGDGRAGEGPAPPFIMDFDSAEIEDGPLGYMVEDRDLRPLLDKHIKKTSRIDVMRGCVVLAHHPRESDVMAVLDNGRTITARLLVAADGKQSTMAAQAGIRHIRWDYGQTALVATIAHRQAHNGIAYQFFMPPGPLAILPLAGVRSSIVWSEKTADAVAITTLSEREFLSVLQPRFGSFLGAIQLDGPRYTYPLSLSLAQRMIAPRLALVGDAAHGMHPIAGQGLNAGLRDITALADVLNAARKRGEDIGAPSVLQRYERWRRFDNTALTITTDMLNRVFSNDHPLLRLGRDLGLGLVTHWPALRRSLIREAAGLTGS